jgi:hypothetical protein
MLREFCNNAQAIATSAANIARSGRELFSTPARFDFVIEQLDYPADPAH